jgi:hypothetical protein
MPPFAKTGDPRREASDKPFKLNATPSDEEIDYYALMALMFGLMVNSVGVCS